MKILLITKILILWFVLFQSCKKEPLKEQSLEEYVLERLHNECGGIYKNIDIKEVIKVWVFKDTEFTVSYFAEGFDASDGIYLKYKEGDTYAQQYTGLITRCGPMGNFELGEKYLISGYGITFHDSGGGIVESRGFPLIIENIKLVE